MTNITKEKISSNLAWRLMERFGAQGVSLVVSIILARKLEPSVYGTIGLVMVFITILQVFVDSGLGNALIQKKDADEVDFSTVFYFNIVFCLILYAIIFFLAPLISRFYNNESLIQIIRVLGLTVIISGTKNVQQAYVSVTMQFKKFFWSTLGGTIVAAIVGIIMAYRGYGVWALVAQNLINQTIDTIIVWLTVRWHPQFVFSVKRLKKLFSYGVKLLLAKLIDTFYVEIRALIIGKKYSSADLGFYNKGQQFPKLIVINIDNAVESVLFPVMSSEQDDLVKVKELLRKTIQINTYIICPLMVGLAACAKGFIVFLLTEKWINAVPYLRIFCFIYAFTVFNTVNMNTYRSLGKSGTYLKIEIIRKAIGFLMLIISMNIGVLAMTVSEAITMLISLVINTYPNKRILGYGLKEQLKDMAKPLIISVLMGIIVWGIEYSILDSFICLIVQIFVGIIIYILLSELTKPQGYICLKNIINKKNKVGGI